MAQETLFAVSAGFCGSLGALSAKLAFGELSYTDDSELFLLALTTFILANVFMWWSFTKSLSTAQNTMQPLMFNMGTNFVLTGIFGTVIFHEAHNWLWWFGLMCVITGLAMILFTEAKTKPE